MLSSARPLINSLPLSLFTSHLESLNTPPPMAAFREHITVSGVLGLGYGVMAYVAYGFTAIESTLAGFLTAFGGMLPDLDSKTSRPVRELFGILAAIVPLLVLGETMAALHLPSTREAGALTFIALYMVIRYGGA